MEFLHHIREQYWLFHDHLLKLQHHRLQGSQEPLNGPSNHRLGIEQLNIFTEEFCFHLAPG